MSRITKDEHKVIAHVLHFLNTYYTRGAVIEENAISIVKHVNFLAEKLGYELKHPLDEERSFSEFLLADMGDIVNESNKMGGKK